MAILRVDIGACRSRAQLAAALRVPAPALDLVTTTSRQCKRLGCPLSAVSSNNG